MHTVLGGPATSPPLVCLPGYGAGAAFYFRNIDDLAKQFRLHLVDLLGTGMSGIAACQIPNIRTIANALWQYLYACFACNGCIVLRMY